MILNTIDKSIDARAELKWMGGRPVYIPGEQAGSFQ